MTESNYQKWLRERQERADAKSTAIGLPPELRDAVTDPEPAKAAPRASTRAASKNSAQPAE
ncbi:hypothetical protein BH09ACT6_BH09ACT6_18670 [soil metagenome]